MLHWHFLSCNQGCVHAALASTCLLCGAMHALFRHFIVLMVLTQDLPAPATLFALDELA